VATAAAGGVFIAALVGYSSVYMVWRWWERREVSRFFSREGFELVNIPLALILLLEVLAVVIAFGWIFMPHGVNAWEEMGIFVLYLVGFAGSVAAVQSACQTFGRSSYFAAGLVWLASFQLVFSPALMWATAERPSATAYELAGAALVSPFWAFYVVGSLVFLLCAYVGLLGPRPFLRRWLEDWTSATPLSAENLHSGWKSACLWITPSLMLLLLMMAIGTLSWLAYHGSTPVPAPADQSAQPSARASRRNVRPWPCYSLHLRRRRQSPVVGHVEAKCAPQKPAFCAIPAGAERRGKGSRSRRAAERKRFESLVHLSAPPPVP
jgi:hypothetical protein